MSAAHLSPLAVTMGEPAGIGGELTLLAWRARRQAGPAFFAIDDARRLAALANKLSWTVPIEPIDNPAQAAAAFARALPVLHRALPAPVTPGQPNSANADTVVQSIAQAVDLVRAGHASAIVTNPIHKAALYGAGFKFPGHTEYLEHLCGAGTSVMMLVAPTLRVVPVTIHLPLRQAIAELTADAIVSRGVIAARALQRDFGIGQPRLAVAGLNPHAGEGGALGSEDGAIVAPAVERLRAQGIDARGPLPPDTMFHERARQTYDAALCMYHDQALIPLKTIDFYGGVNVTLGLPIVRTSPDHGTAFDIAGSGKAEPASLLAALDLAAAIARNRAKP